MSKTVTTPKGTTLPLVNLKGKDYLMVAHRIQWFAEEVKNYVIDTQQLVMDDTQTVTKATISILDDTGKLIKRAMATKRETKADFSDHTEKSETAAIGRALASLGYGTQFALSDLDEGTRLADSPVANTKTTAILAQNGVPITTKTEVVEVMTTLGAVSNPAAQSAIKKTPYYRKPANGKANPVASNDDGGGLSW